MTFSREEYKTNRSEANKLFNTYSDEIQKNSTSKMALFEARAEILKLYYYELLILQSSIKQWEKLMTDPDLNFRRELCTKLYNLERAHIMTELGLSDGAVSNLFHKSTLPVWPRPFQLSALWNHPWQLINKINPDPYSYPESPEYFHHGVSKRIKLRDLSDERSKVTSIRGYVIIDSQNLFQHESAPVAGRWVTTYPEFDYFEFLLNYEPLVDKVLRDAILQAFPLAKHLITTYRPFKPLDKRSLWVIIPKDETMPTYPGMLHELKEYRDHTEYHNLE